MNAIIKEAGIKERDVKVIIDIIYDNPTSTLIFLNRILLRVFGENIKPGHYTMLGYLIGYHRATDNALNELYKNVLCQKLN